MSGARTGATIEFATPSQLLLLQAALLEKKKAAEAALAWLTVHRAAAGPGFCSLESGSRRLLPLVYRNVKELLPVNTQSELRNVYVEYWSKNQQVFHRLEKLLNWFESCGVPTLVLKGVPLSILHYGDRAVRPMADFDILVPEERAREVILRLESEGWTSYYFAREAPRYRYFLRHVHAIPLTHAVHGDLDLHWHVSCEVTFRGADRAFWNDSVPLHLNTTTTRALNPTDQLIHTCVHGYAANVEAPIRWIADAFTVLRTNQIDWSRLMRLSKELRLTIPLRAGLAFLRDRFSAAVPGEVIGELASVRVGTSEQHYFERLCNLGRSWQEIFADNCERHRRANRDVPPILRLTTLPRQLQLHYNLLHFRDIRSFTRSLLSRRISRIVGPS
jgi:hypothetical protein